MMKITIKLAKPRNPFVALARQRPGGAHGGYRPPRLARRSQKQNLRDLLSGSARRGNDDE